MPDIEAKTTTNIPLECFVIMPFGLKGEYAQSDTESSYIFNNIICSALNMVSNTQQIEFNTIREVDKKTSGNINRSIIENIAKADVCIVDITGLNPNVFLELGIRYSLRPNTTVLLKQKDTQIPFDIFSYKCIEYHCYKPEKAITELVDYLNAGLSDNMTTDSPVFETFPNLQVEIPGYISSKPGNYTQALNASAGMPWDEWWKRIKDMINTLKHAVQDGRVQVDAVLGISNGGLMVADILGREAITHVPIVSLWADRRDKSNFFDNSINRAVLGQLKDSSSTQPLKLLLVDDIVYTSNTVKQAKEFIYDALGKNTEIIFTPLYCHDLSSLVDIQDILPSNYRGGRAFDIPKEEYYARLTTRRPSLPYGKKL